MDILKEGVVVIDGGTPHFAGFVSLVNGGGVGLITYRFPCKTVYSQSLQVNYLLSGVVGLDDVHVVVFFDLRVEGGAGFLADLLAAAAVSSTIAH